MQTKTITKENLNAFVEGLIKAGSVVGVTKMEGKFAFAPLKKASELTLDYDVTLLPPKKYIQPQRETLIKFKIKPEIKAEAVIDSAPLTIIGVHPYDLKAINQLDRLFEEKHVDDNYMKRRSQTTIIAVTPTRASKWSFWSSMDSIFVGTGFDLMLTDLGGKYAVEIGTACGDELLKKHAKCEEASAADVQKLEDIRRDLPKMCASERKINAQTEEMTAIIEIHKKSELWEKRAEKCYSCGSCNLICPTCYCFDVKEDLALGLNEGTRYRMWDGCLLEEFAKIASGENFREERADRFRHRFYRKWSYLVKKLSEPACVGCGRCSSVCLPDIADPVKVINELKEEK
jgi:formate hydrogenlyase subunit 6/NADH:ubiquinone oxidoreductase subunit I